MRVLLADGEPDVRWAMRTLLTQDLGIQVAGEAADADELWTQLRITRADLLVLDWRLLGAEPAATLQSLRALYPCLQVIVLSGQQADQQALAAGADAFVSKAESPEQLVQTLRAARMRHRKRRLQL